MQAAKGSGEDGSQAWEEGPSSRPLFCQAGLVVGGTSSPSLHQPVPVTLLPGLICTLAIAPAQT